MKAYFLWLAKFVTTIVVVFVLLPVLLVGSLSFLGATLSKPETSTASYANPNTVAVLELGGVIMNSKDIIKQLKKQIENKSVKGIVLRIDSPGGSVAPSQEIYDAVRELKEKKPIVVSMGSVAASGGLYAALGASKVFAQKGTLTGSIGVIMQFPNFSEIAEQFGFSINTIKSGPFKDVGNSFRSMTDFEREYLQVTVNNVKDQFVEAIVEGRGLELAKVQQIADGRIFTGEHAKSLGLVDEIGGVLEAARAVFEIKGEPLAEDEDPFLVYPSDKFEVFKKIFEAASEKGLGLLSGNPFGAYREVKLLYIM